MLLSVRVNERSAVNCKLHQLSQPSLLSLLAACNMYMTVSLMTSLTTSSTSDHCISCFNSSHACLHGLLWQYRLLYKTTSFFVVSSFRNKEKRRKQQGNYFSGCFIQLASDTNKSHACNQGNHYVVKITNLFLVCGIETLWKKKTCQNGPMYILFMHY